MERVFVAPISFGLGDLVVSLPAIQALIAEGAPRGDQIWLVARSAVQHLLAPRVDGLAGSVDETSPRPTSPGDRFIDLRDHPMQRDRWWGSAAFEQAFGRLDINQILARICEDLGIHADFRYPVALDARRRPELTDTVLLVTEADGSAKSWPAERWTALAAELAGDGLDVRQVTRSGASPALLRTGIAELHAPTPGDAVDVLTACRGVIGIDTGLTHLAVQQGTPTVTICRRSSVYFRPWVHCRDLRGGDCTEQCVAAETAYAYHGKVSLRDFRTEPRACPSATACLDGTRADEAAGLLRELL